MQKICLFLYHSDFSVLEEMPHTVTTQQAVLEGI